MSKYIDYKPIHVDKIDYNKCKWLYNQVCCNDKSEFLADYPYPRCKCEDDTYCKCFEKEDGKV